MELRSLKPQFAYCPNCHGRPLRHVHLGRITRKAICKVCGGRGVITKAIPMPEDKE